MSSESSLFEHTPCHAEGFLQVSDVHCVFYQVFGKQNLDAPAAIFLHGGPGGGCNPRVHRFFDPQFYRIVCFDQRGCGRSEPNAAENSALALTDNNTWSCVEDIEKLRKHLGVDKWHCVFGGSWGSTLALAYSQTYPAMVKSIVLRGVFLFLQEDMDWLFEVGGASEIYPDKFERYVSIIPEEERGQMIEAYYKRLTSEDETTRFEAARHFVEWELNISKVKVDEERIKSTLSQPRTFAPFATFECVFFKNKGFLNTPTQLLDNCPSIVHIPMIIVHGRQDVVCRPAGAWKLHKLLPLSKIEFIADAGHSDSEPGTEAGLVRATEAMKSVA